MLHQPDTFDDALALRTAEPEALVVAGGTGVLPALTNGTLRPPALLDLSRVADRAGAERDGDALRLGPGTTYTDVLERHAQALPGLALAARTVASRQVRNRGTLAGALVLADPSGDVLAALVAAGATVELRSVHGAREVLAEDFIAAPGCCVLGARELVAGLQVPVARGPVAYAKAGARNAMARAVCGVAVALDPAARRVSAGIVGAHPTAVRPVAAERHASALEWDAPLPDEEARAFGARAAATLRPVADARGSAEYRRHVASVLARRALARAWEELPRWG